MDLTKITTPFGLLDAETQRALKDCGGPWESFDGNTWICVVHPGWHSVFAYRQKPQTLTQDTIPWAQIDKRFKWAARDANGEAFAFETKPDNMGLEWCFDEGDYRRIDDLLTDYRPGTCDWRDSLQQRPESD